MADILVFKRVEKKYIIDESQKSKLLSELREMLEPDSHGRSTVASIYLDSPDYKIIRASLDAKVYKEKLRIRAYGVPTHDSKVFFELKKKYEGVVYKRREKMTLAQAMHFCETHSPPRDSQIMRELAYSLSFYCSPKPSMLVAYEREAYFVKNAPHIRLTFDSAVRYRSDLLDLSLGHDGSVILPKDKYILEIKTDGAMPIEVADALDRLTILPASFSKYGTAYRDMIQKGELINA